MLKKRLIAVLPVYQGIVVQSLNFSRYLPVGRPTIVADFLNRWGIDEIVLLDIEASQLGRKIDMNLVRDVSRLIYVPLTIGGGINSSEDIKQAVSSGADKVAVNTGALRDPGLISEGAKMFGSQCIVVSLDVIRDPALGEYRVYSRNLSSLPNPVEFAREAEARGAGEILLNVVGRDGAKTGYDLDICSKVASSVGIPVIICGGVGHPKHFVEGLNLPNISAIAAGNFFHFQEHSPIAAKRYILNKSEHSIRLDSYADYLENSFDGDGRLARKSDPELEKLFFEFHPKEVI